MFSIGILLIPWLCFSIMPCSVVECASCGGVVKEWSYNLQSPNYPMTYAPNLDCEWVLTVSPGSAVVLSFNDFEMASFMTGQSEIDGGCQFDYVEMRDGPTKDSPMIGKRVCGALPPMGSFSSTGDSMFVLMHTDGSRHFRGFSAQMEGNCKQTLSRPSGIITTPNYPKKYDKNMQCAWVIDLGLGNDVTLVFDTFNLEKSDGCSYDWVKVQAGNTESGGLLGHYCHTIIPPDHFTEGPMRLSFNSDSDDEYQGFKATYRAVDRNECLKPDACHSNATCTNTNGSYVCACLLSYTGDGKSCTWYRDYDECKTGVHNCHVDALCINTITYFKCQCKPGFQGDGFECKDVDECTAGPDVKYRHNCHQNATCTNTHGSFQCKCISVYTGNGVNCVDTDECAVGTHNCHKHATCINTDGSFTCKCNEGYAGNGIICSDVNECTAKLHNCHVDANCTNTDGSFYCTCHAGHTGNGVSCTDIDECTTGTHNCHSDGKCTNLKGTFMCTCKTGYTGNGVTCVGTGLPTYLLPSNLFPFSLSLRTKSFSLPRI